MAYPVKKKEDDREYLCQGPFPCSNSPETSMASYTNHFFNDQNIVI